MANSTNGRWPPPHPETQTHPHCFNFSPFIRGFAAGITLLLFIVCIIYILQYLIFRPILLALRLDSLQFVNFSATAAAPSWARTRRFLLPPRNSTTLVSPFIADLLVDESVLNDIHGDLERGTIDFTVVVLGYANVEIGVWRPIGTDIRVVCSDLSVKFSWPPGLSGRSGQLVGGSRQCHLH
ncbi:hypothetical protein Csa_022841 [Cucumis sativus]|nr:hypothetical protein Csa_022841 [Cucumis sativus]